MLLTQLDRRAAGVTGQGLQRAPLLVACMAMAASALSGVAAQQPEAKVERLGRNWEQRCARPSAPNNPSAHSLSLPSERGPLAARGRSQEIADVCKLVAVSRQPPSAARRLTPAGEARRWVVAAWQPPLMLHMLLRSWVAGSGPPMGAGRWPALPPPPLPPLVAATHGGACLRTSCAMLLTSCYLTHCRWLERL